MPAQTPEEVALRARLLVGIDDCLRSEGPDALAAEIEDLWHHVRSAIRAAAQAERERIAAELRREAAADDCWADGAYALRDFADRLHPAPEGGE
jgi:hypothetical protein